jgi:hypothetical protein
MADRKRRKVTGVTATTPEERLSPPQLAALAALLGRATITQAAARAGVARQTVHEWLKADTDFIAAYNGGRSELIRRAREDLRELAPAAVRRLRAILTTTADDSPAIMAVQVKAAIEVLAMIGLNVPEPIGPCEPDAVAAELASQAQVAELDRALAGLDGDGDQP